MSTQVRAAGESDIEPICALLHEKMNNRIPVSRWRNLMSYKWFDGQSDYGRVVESEGRILGFCGMVYANRLVGNAAKGLRQERIVSMSSWYLDKSLRGKGFGREMLLSAIEDRSLTYATLTNSKKPLGIVEGLGFRVLEDHRYIWRKTDSEDPAISVINDVEVIRARVEPHQFQLLDDMSEMPVAPMLLEYDGRKALLVFSVKTKGADVTWFDLLHASDLDLFVECAQVLTNCLLPDSPSVLAADGRFVRQAPAGVTVERLPVARYFVSDRVEPWELDNLYSELQLLDLKLD